MSTVDVARVADTEDVLGEVPIWSVEEQALYWMDALKPALHRLVPETGVVTSWRPPEKLGSFALRAGGGLLLAARSGLAFFDPDSGAFETKCEPEPNGPDNLLNDGRCDRKGRFWVGSMSRMIDKPSGRLHRFDPDLSCHTLDDGIYVANGLAWSLDDRTMYFADSHRHEIYAYDFDLETGAIGTKRVFARVSESNGVPDGATVDSQGFLWSAVFNFDTSAERSHIVRYDPAGGIERTIEVPVSRPTSLAFGGPNLDILYVTSASFRLSAEQRARQPWTGGVLALEPGVRGLPEPRFAG